MKDKELIQGTVVAGFGGFYQVRLDSGVQVECKARGRIRQQHRSILTGDWVLISQQAPGKGMVEQILERRNQLQRPHIANVDQALIVLAWRLPDYDLLLLDNMLLMCRLAGIKTVLCFNKTDLMLPQEQVQLEQLRSTYTAADCPVLALSTLSQPDVSVFYPYLSGQRTVLAGPSGVGKSSLLNLLLPEENAQTAAVSTRLQRGRHTTRYVRLLPLPGDSQGGMLADTPGFFVLDAPRELTADTLAQHYPDFNRIMQHAGGCRFDGCRHDREPDCVVKDAVEAGILDAGRYQRYIRILHEIIEREVKY